MIVLMRIESLLIGLSLLLSACSGEEGTSFLPEDGKVDLILSGVEDGTAVTRAGDKPLPEGIWLGVYAIGHGKNFLTEAAGNRNTWYKVVPTGGITPYDIPARMEVGKMCTVYAYAPRHGHVVADAEAADARPVIRHGDDALWAIKSVDRVDLENRNVQLSFTHRTACIRFTLAPGVGATAEDLRGATMVAQGFAAEGCLSLATGIVSTLAGDRSEAEVWCVGTTGISEITPVIPGQRTIRFVLTLADHAASPGVKELTAELPLEPGYFYEYTIRYNNARPMELQQVSVEPWRSSAGGGIEM